MPANLQSGSSKIDRTSCSAPTTLFTRWTAIAFGDRFPIRNWPPKSVPTDPTTDLDVNKIYLMVKAIKLARFTKTRPLSWIDKPPGAPEPNDLILASNGIFDLKTGELIPHSGRYFATALPEWNYDPEATCPLWLEKLGQWLHPSFHATLQEFMGYLLTPDTSIEVLLAMIGAKRGGKGSITRIMQALVGTGSHASMMLNDLAGDFGLSGVTDKRVIIIPDRTMPTCPAAPPQSNASKASPGTTK